MHDLFSVVTMEEEETRRLLDGVVDVVTPAMERERTHSRLAACPICQQTGSVMVPHPVTPFTAGEVFPNMVNRCLSCRCLYDYHTGFVLSAPNPTSEASSL